MPRKCCMPACRGNYDNGPKVSVFLFPADEHLKKKWISAVHRKDWTPSKQSVVCQLHFKSDDILTTTEMYDPKTGKLLSAPLAHPRLRKEAVPSLLPGCPDYLSNNSSSAREEPESRRERIQNDHLQRALQESATAHSALMEEASIKNLDELKFKFNKCGNDRNWLLMEQEDGVTIVLLTKVPYPRVICYIIVKSDLFFNLFVENSKIKSVGGIHFPKKVSNTFEISKILDEIFSIYTSDVRVSSIEDNISYILDILDTLLLKIPESERKINFIKEQVSLLKYKGTQLRYKWDSLILWSLLHSVSPHAYRFLRSSLNISMPCPNTLSKLCNKLQTNPVAEQHSKHFMRYMTDKVGKLDDKDKNVLLLMDEIHLKPLLDFKGGNIVGGASQNETYVCATSAHVFMIQSLDSPYKDVVHILPVHTIQADMLFSYIKKVIVELESIGIAVVGVVADNNAINKKAMSYFSDPPKIKIKYKNPINEDRPLYYFVDTVHILKCIRNNWFNQKEGILYFPDFSDMMGGYASLEALKILHVIEKDELLQYGSTLTFKSLYPNSLEKQNVKLAINVLNEKTAVALKELGPIKSIVNWQSTSTFIHIISQWWSIVNVKTLLKGLRLRNEFQQPVTRDSNHIFDFLENFMKWLDSWNSSQDPRKLTKETHFAISHTTTALIDFIKYWLFEKNRSYLLLGKIQTDSLEARFGKYRQLSGGNYHVSLRQVFETEGKLRAQSVFSLVLKSQAVGEVVVTRSDVTNSFISAEDVEVEVPDFLNVVVNEADIEEVSENAWPLLRYISGYCSHQVLKKTKCKYCRVFLTTDEVNQSDSLISAMDRGGLKYPSEDVILCVTYAYLTIKKIIAEQETLFLQQPNQKKIVVKVSANNVPNNVFEGFYCRDGHTTDMIKNIILLCCTNILLNNYCKRQNDAQGKKRNMPMLKRAKKSPHVGSR